MYPRKKWNEVLTIVSGKNQKAVENPDGKYPIYGSGGIIGHADDYLCGADTVIVGRKGTIDNPLYVSEPFWNIDTAFGVVAGEELLPKYLFYFCRLFNFKSLDKSTGRPSIAKSDLLKIEMPVPEKNIQERILAQIEELFSELDNAEATLQATKQQLAVYRQAVLRKAFCDIGDASEDTIESVCTNIVDCPHSTPKWVDAGRLCLRTTNFKRGFLDLSEPNYVSQETFDIRNTRLIPMPGDILYSREGAILGIACIIPSNTYVCLGQRMMLLRAGARMNNKFLMYYLNSPKLTRFVATVTGGSASPHVNVGDIKKFKIPVPPMSVQMATIDYLEREMSVCDAIEKSVNDTMQELNAMRQSVLKEAFEGGVSYQS